MDEPPDDRDRPRLSRFLTCPTCGHERHTYLPCSDTCACERA